MFVDVFKDFWDFFLGDLTGKYIFNGGSLGFVNIDLYDIFISIFSLLVVWNLIVKPFYLLLNRFLGKKGK